MNILLCAYACEPNKGSEPGIGWKWGMNLAKNSNNNIYILTRTNNKSSINNFFRENVKPKNLFFLYYDLPSFIIWLKHKGLPTNIYYSLWLYGSGIYSKKLHKEYNFDIAHHITFGVFRDASFLYKLNIPYMLGPLGGGESTPPHLLSFFSFFPLTKEYIRILINKISLYNPFLIKSLNKASIILSKTIETEEILSKWRNKTYTHLELGIDKLPDINNLNINKRNKTFLFIGRFLSWKGTDIVLYAFYEYLKKYNDDSKLIMIGKGENFQKINKFIINKKLESHVSIVPWIEQSELIKYYRSCRALIFPSMHDSSGNVVLEAISNGLPVISLDCGGPATILGKNLNDVIVQTKNNSKEKIIASIVSKMNKLNTNVDFYNNIQQKSIERAEDFLWYKVIDSSYNIFLEKIMKQ